MAFARLIFVALLGLGCSSKPEKLAHPGSQTSASETDSSLVSAAIDGGGDAGGQRVDAGAEAGIDAGPRAVVRMGVNSLPAADMALADLDVVAVGSQATTVSLRWNTASIEEAIERARWFSGQDVAVLFAVDVVQGAVVAGLDLEERGQWVKDAINAVYEADVGVAALVFGEALDLSIEQLEPAQRKQLRGAVDEWLTYAMRHHARPTELLVGVHTQAKAWLQPTTELLAWSAVADLVAVSWHGLDDAGYAQPVAAAKTALDEQLDALETNAPSVWFRELSYPMAERAKSDLEQQSKAYAQVWELFAERPERQPFVAISALYDPPSSECERFAQTYALPDRASAAQCSIGLKEVDGRLRPAFASVVAGMAAFAPSSPNTAR